MTQCWTKICNVADVTSDSIFAGEVHGAMIAIYLVADRYYATDNVCSHAFALLSDGWVEDQEVECPLHGARFNIQTGKVTQGPAACDLKTFKVRVEDDEIQCLI